jgi:hypothetical protein
MLSQKIIIIFFILIILTFIICTIFLPNLPKISTSSSNEKFNELAEELPNKIQNNEDILKYNLNIVDKFSKKEITFNTIENPNKNITKNQPFYDPSVFPKLSNINNDIVKEELLNYLQNSNDKWIEWPEYDLWKNNDSKASWKIIPLMSFGKWSSKNTKNFPNTTNQLKNIDGLISAGFSKLGPNTTLTLHKGWGNLSNNVLRCHLGLIIPTNKCKVFVMGNTNDEMIQKENKWIVFDDSLYHSASNDDDEKERIILLLDIKRPTHIPKGESDIDNSPELNNFINEFNKNL